MVHSICCSGPENNHAAAQTVSPGALVQRLLAGLRGSVSGQTHNFVIVAAVCSNLQAPYCHRSALPYSSAWLVGSPVVSHAPACHCVVLLLCCAAAVLRCAALCR
jgi:hypothetical protein